MSQKTKKKSRTSFGATAPPFIDYLKDILQRYPDGGQILKELIQNADDAQATEVVFIHDDRSYGTESLWTQELGQYQGPALYVYNDASFTEEDWEGIQLAGRSFKRNDPNKVGRFGIGFNSVYHITDLPCILSGSHLGFMDPQEQIFGEREGGFRWYMDDPQHQEYLTTMHDQFQPIRDIVSLISNKKWSSIVTEHQYFNGTLFRFPLRNRVSEISDNLYNSGKVADLFESFITDAELSLLFLKNVASVSLKHVTADGEVSTRLQVTSSALKEEIRESGNEFQASTRSKVITQISDDQKETTWLLTTCTMKKGSAENLDSLAEKLSFSPRVDLAFPFDEEKGSGQGRVCCFLPLPDNESNKTGLPVYVNACFGLTDNRRQIKWPESDQKHDEHALWNELLVKQVLPQTYLFLIKDAIKLAQECVLPSSRVYQLWPDISKMEHKDKWHAVALDVLQHLFRENMAVLSLAKDETKFIPPSEALLPCNGPTSSDILAALKRTLVSRGENLVTLPPSISRAIAEAHPHPHTLKHVTPAFMRGFLRGTDMQSLSEDDKFCLLKYVLSDKKYKDLQDLQLLPLSDGSFRAFTQRKIDTALIDSRDFPRDLLPCCQNLFIPDNISPGCRNHLEEMAAKRLFSIIVLTAHHVAEYTQRFLPEDWKGTGSVTWNVSSSKHPPLKWLQDFWKFLNTHFKELSKFTGMPLIPVSPVSANRPVSLARLQKNTTLIFSKSKQNELPAGVAELVKEVGGTVVEGHEWLRHSDLDSYVLCPSPKSVLKVLRNLHYEGMIGKLSTCRAKEELKDYLSHLESVSPVELEFLLKLPLFQTMKGSYVPAQSKQALLLVCDVKVPTDFPLPDSVVRCATEADRRLLLLLKVKLLDAAEAAVLLVDCIERRAFTEEDTKRVMAWILQHGKVLFSQNVHLKRKCKELRFMQVKGGAKEASSFFDPANETFKVIFESEFFPPRSFTQTPQMLESLRDLGLINKEADVTPEHLLHAATLIEQSVVDSSHEATTRAGALLNILDRYDLLSKFSNRQLNHLQMKKWIPCPKFSSGDGSQTTCFFCPDEIRHPMYKDIVGHVMPLLGQFRDQFSTKLGLKRLPPPKKVIENLSALMSIAETMPDPDKNVDFKRQLRCIYEHMQKHKSDFVSIMNKEKRWLWSRDRFVSPQDLVLEYPQNLDLSSYIGKVPEEFLSFKDLLQEFGLRRTLSDVEIVSVLKSIQGTVEERQPPFANSSEIKVSIEILNWLWRERKRVEGDVPVPVHTDGGQYTFKPSSTVVFCDVNKTGLRELRCSREELYVTHEEITKAAAEWLNIRFLSTHILNPELVGIEQCGQSEPITTRIRNILKEYDEESDIFKELIQNAEDAGAEQCKFLVDFRAHKYSPEELIDRDMSLCQGPCLWAFNNETFKDDDWANIVRVGSASKENQVEKIGKFGLGFNTVYHVTDIPSVLSGTSLLILDPNVTHLKTHINNKSNPGIKLNLSQRELFKCFPGQFGPYERIFDCDFTQQNPYAGTLIRLPFRTEEEALTSEISQRVFCKYDINSFLECLCEDSKIHLLFLRNICTLALDRIPKDASTPPRDAEIETMLQVSKTPVTTFRIPDETHVAEQQKFEKLLMKDDVKGNGVDYHKANVVKVTSQLSGVTEVQSWLLYSCFGTQQSIKMALQENKQARFSLPIGGVAVPLQIDANTEKLALMETDFSGKAFCFLPLSIHTGLPVNINGAFAVTSNRKGLWQSGVKGDWNKALLQDPIVNAYVTALLVLKEMAETKQLEPYSYHTFWPHREKVSDNFKSLVDAFYSRICQPSSGLELFYNGELWCAMSSAIFLHESIEEDKDIGSLAVQVCKKHVRAPNHVVPLPQWLRNSFKQAGLGNDLQSRTWNWEKFYQQAVFNNLDAIDSKTRDSLVLHAIDLNSKEIDDLLVRFPCIPTKAGPLQYISKLVNPCGKVACLFELEEERLLGGTSSDFCSPKRIQRLLALGMASEDLSLEDIAEKAGTIISIWSTNRPKAYVLLRILLDLVKKHMNESPRGKDSAHWETIKMTKFLPAFCPGDTSSVALERPMVIYNDKCSLLVNMTQPVLDHSNLNINHNDPVLTFLGVNESPRPETVLQQLQESYRQSQSTDKSVLHKIANECYNFLNQCLADPNTTGAIRQMANSFPFIFVGSMFVHVNRVAENEQFDAKPYLYVLPPNFGHFKRLWDCVGVEKRFTVEQFHTVLKELHSRYGRHTLSHSDLSVCFTILNKGIYEAEKEAVGDCLIPNEDGVLQHASELVYNDSQWMPVPSGVTLCHKNIARAAALHFGVNTTRHGTLNNCEVKDMSPFAFQFEQQEQLTVRIKNIISAYPSKKDILKELIQNADDAEATEIHFVWDKRQHDVEKTFGENWNQLQGPALCVFNNKVFSDADLKGIQRLGEGGKHSTPGKTGRYGVGFNSVYHLTDCPSILTGDELLCISDPNQIYIERHSDKASSGIGYKLDDTFKEMYADVYKSFLPDEFRLGEGTMFRLPLRRGAMANSSKLSNIEVTDFDMKELCSALSADSDGLILFLKNISKIQVHEISDKHSGKIKTIYAVQKSISQRSQEQKKEFVKLRLEALKSHTAGKPQKVIYETTVTTSDKKETKWIIAEQFGSSNTSEREISDQLPQAAVAARLSIHVPRAQFLPSIVKFTGGAFCSLPLPGTTGLPVHVNANFEVDSSRRGLWKEDGPSPKSVWNKLLKEEVIAFLYADLLQYISSGISRVPFSDESFLYNAYLHFWPIVSKTVDQEWHNMILEVYKSIHKRGLRVIPLLRISTSVLGDQIIKDCSYDWCNISETELTKAPHLIRPGNEELDHILEDLGMILVPFSFQMQNIWDTFKNAGVELQKVSPKTVQNFLRETRLNDPVQTDQDLPLPIADTLIRDEGRCAKLLSFCLQNIEKGIEKLTDDNSSSFNGIPLLLTRDKMLRVFSSDSPKLISQYEGLFITKAQFADFVTNFPHIHVLQKFNLVKALTVPEAKPYLQPVIQHLLQECELHPDTGLHVPNQKTLKWLYFLWQFLTSEIKPETSDEEEKSLKMRDVRTLFSDFCIVPVVCPRLNNKQFLTTMGTVSKVILSSSDISHILFDLGFMKLDQSCVGKHVCSLLRTELMDLNDRSAVLEQLCHLNPSEFSKLSTQSLRELQSFLQDGLSRRKNLQNYQSKLKSLPIFLTVHGERVRIDGPKDVFVSNIKYSETFPQLFVLGDNKSILLQGSLENYSLSTSLKIQVLSDVDYFMKFILPDVHTLAQPQLLQCLKLILSLQYDGDYLKHKDAITSSLKTVKLIPNSQGTLETASYYFDEEVELYKTMLPQERFIPERFWAELCGENLEARKKPQELLRELGMRHVVSSDDITQFAHQLESEANGDSKLETLKRKSSLLFQVALEFVKNTDKTLLKSIAHIKFIIPKPVQKELCDYHRPFAAGRTTVSIRGSLIESDHNHQELIWSTMPIVHMPVYMSPDLKKMMTNAGAFEQPPSDRVTRTLHNICRLPCTNDTLIRTRAQVFRSCYAYLQKNSFNSASLAGLPIVLVENDKKLVTAEDACIFLHESYNFRPYLYKILRQDAIFEDFFRKIGVTENATAEQYCKVLATIHDDSEDKLELNANQKATVRCAVAQIFNLIEKEKNSHQLSNIETLYLPATDGKLHLSSTLHYNNTVFEIRRLEDALKNKFLLLEKLSHYLGTDIYKHHQLLQLLPQKLQPKMLSGITKEKVREHNMQRCELEPDCEFSGWFQNHLSSQPFRHGLICLIREQENGQITEKEVADMCTKTFGSIQIVCCRTLETALWLENEELPTTTSETDVFVKREQEDCIFYLRHNDITVPKELNSIIMTLTKEINALLENKIASNHLQVLGHLLMCDDIDDVKKALAKHEIHDSAEVESSLFSAPAAGADIPEEWYDSLDMSFLNNYEEGEYVGYWTNDKYIYAIIVEELSGIYGPHSKRFKIDIGQDEPIEVSCLDLYQFKRSKKPDARRFGTSAESSHMNLVPVKGAKSASRPSTRSSPASLEEAKREIDKCLEEIWLLPEGERNKAFKRLYLRWHPDKNINCHNLATEAFKYLKNRIDELLNGRAQNAGSAHRGTNQDFRNFYGSWNQEANYHRRGRERFYGAHRHYNFWAFNRNVPQPNRKEAQRWCRQARCDLQAARKDVDGSSTEWCLFKVHQAVEKSLIAAVYKRQGQHPNSSITDMATQVSHYSDLLRGVPQIVETLKRLGVDGKKTQYPNFHPFPNIPNEQFSAENGRQALDQASQLLRVIESYVN
ncbi:sacsin [Takifugu rubripes]|uniref:Sacsin-like n=1 Tax=Takifugu rubripes TaxID=31033 RepID=H2U816_TAKRU|nr:sacsin-like [Takifugu rubripes]